MKIKENLNTFINSDVYKTVIKPTLNIASSGSFNIIDQFASKVLKDRKQEFIIFLAEHIDLLNNNEVLNNEHFISGLIILYKQILEQRFETKRQRAYGIFLGFISSEDKEMFELERMYNTLNLMSENDIKKLFRWAGSISLSQYSSNTDNFTNLISLGLVSMEFKKNSYFNDFSMDEMVISYNLSTYGRQFKTQLTKR